MARRSTAERGAGAPAFDDVLARGQPGPEYGADAGWTAHGQRQDAAHKSPTWTGSGGRWWIWVGRAVLWAAILIVLVNGVRAIFSRVTAPAATPTSTSTSSSTFPVQGASAFALQFANVYLNLNAVSPDARAAALAPYLPANAPDPQLGWDMTGSMQAGGTQVFAVDVRDDQHAVVRLLTVINRQTFILAVPVYVAGDSMVVSGEPALLPGPRKATVPPATTARDPALESQLSRVLGPFFAAYASGDISSIRRFEAPGASIPTLGGALSFDSISSVVAPSGGSSRLITVRVNWKTSGGSRLEQAYDLTVVEQNGSWYVQDLQGSTQPMGP